MSYILHGCDGLVVNVVRRGKINFLGTLGINRETGDAQVNLTASGYGRNDGVELQVLELDLEAKLLADGLHKLHVKTDILAIFEVLERRIVGRRADDELAFFEQNDLTRCCSA